MPHEQRRDNPGYRVTKEFTDTDGLIHRVGDTYSSLDEAAVKAQKKAGNITEVREGSDVAHRARPDDDGTKAREQTQGGAGSDKDQEQKSRTQKQDREQDEAARRANR